MRQDDLFPFLFSQRWQVAIIALLVLVFVCVPYAAKAFLLGSPGHFGLFHDRVAACRI